MKTPKVDSPKPKLKFNTPKSGLVRKSLGQTPAKSLKKFSAKGEQLLSFVKENEGNVEFKNKTQKKLRMSLPANVLSNNKSSPDLENGQISKINARTADEKLGTPEIPKSGKKKSNVGPKMNVSPTCPVGIQSNGKKTPQDKINSRSVKTPVSAENNTSPVKKNIDLKKAKVPFNLENSGRKTPNRDQSQVKTSPGKSKINSPEVELGLQLEEALSPKSKKKKVLINNKVASQGKVEVLKKNILKTSNASKCNETVEVDTEKSKSKKRRNRKRRSQKAKAEKKPSILKHANALNAVNALLKTTKPNKVDLLDTDKYIYIQFNLVKQCKKSRGVFKILLPHGILPDSPDVCLICPDLKGKRNDPEEAIDYYKEVLKKNNISAITEIIPVRKLKQEYTQYEEIHKLASRLDCVISDGRITNFARLGRKFAKTKKCIGAVNFNSKTLKDDVEKALRKVPIFSSGNGTSFSVKCGRIGMPAKDIADNIVSIGEFFSNNKTLVGDAQNISTISVKSATSSAFPIFVSTVTPNEVQKPKGKEQKADEPVEDEVTTVQDATVVVYPSGNVKVKKHKNEKNSDKGKFLENPSKKIKISASTLKYEKTSDESSGDESFEDDSNINDSSIEEDSVTENETNDEDSEDLSDVSEDQAGGDDGDSVSEEEIEAAEKEYLKELRLLQDDVGKQKDKKGAVKDMVEGKKKKQDFSQNKPANLNKKKHNENQRNSEVKTKQGNISQIKKEGVQNNLKGNKKPIPKKQKKGGSPHLQKNVNAFQKGSPGKGSNQKFKKGPGAKNKK